MVEKAIWSVDHDDPVLIASVYNCSVVCAATGSCDEGNSALKIKKAC